jgi:iron complex transport system substrate-binding protein
MGVSSDAVARENAFLHHSRVRIASLLASATEMVCALGLEEQLVAISHECDYPGRVLDRPRVTRARFDPEGLDGAGIDRAVRDALERHGSVYQVDQERLGRARPDLILTQGICEVCAVPTSLAREAACAIGPDVRVLSLDAHSIAEILDSIAQVGRAAGAGPAAERVVGALRDRMEAVRGRVAGAGRPRVLALEWLDPVFVPGHWVPEMVALAGGEMLLGRPDRRSEAVPWEQVTGIDPDVLIVMPCGYGLDRSRSEAAQYADRLRTAAPRAIAAGRAWVVDGSSYFNRSGPRVADGVEILGRMLHPDLVTDVDLAGRAEIWTGGTG